ncbi:MAG: CDP-alcohol phosphatidyltransferase family protein [Alicyclobacillus sp.]|nr:CDP-alcohol phosphatidyltransferase family protein [Alicyclobacillus sp.]
MTERQRSDFAQINACAKRPTDIWTNYLYYTFSLRLVYLIRNTRISPNGLTLTALVLVLIGSVLYALGTRTGLTVGLILVQISYVFDCADGQLARFRQQYSPIGGWLDQMADRVKEFVMLFALAYGYNRFHPGTRVWMWAMFALFALYVLEYLGQIEMFRRPPATPEEGADMLKRTRPVAAPAPAPADLPAKSEAAKGDDVPTPSAAAEDPGADSFSRMQRLRSLVPFRSFIIGEQYFAMLVFLAFGAVYPYLVFVAVLGFLMAIYRPVVDAVKHRRAVRAKRGAVL